MFPPIKQKYSQPRNYLFPQEVDRLIAAAKLKTVGSRFNHRNATLILLMYRHGLRVSEVIALRWNQIDFATASMHINRRKNGKDSVHPLTGIELRALRQLQRESIDSPYVFISDRKAPLGDRTVREIIKEAGITAGLDLKIHPHMLRHSCGYYLANKGFDTRSIQDYLGHKNINHTVLYTQLSPHKFNSFWLD